MSGPRPLVVLGATGSIGQQTLDVARAQGFHVAGLAARRPSEAFASLADEFGDARLVVTGAAPAERASFATRVGPERISFEADDLADLARLDSTVVNGVVGAAGLRASFAAVEAGNRLALANKESIVAAGRLLIDAAARAGGEIVPVDSEHSALFQLLGPTPSTHVASLMLTASGGPFRGMTRDDLHDVTPEQALAHPTWSMGDRISIDSATLANKALEVIEATVLFDVPAERVEVVVHPQSTVHAMIGLVDGTVLAHLGRTDMHDPIEYALTHPERTPGTPFRLAGLTLEFEEPDTDTFPALALGFEAAREGGSLPAVFNAADEIAVAAFLQRRLGFTTIPTVIASTMESMPRSHPTSIEDVLAVDAAARELAASLVAGAC